MTNRWIVKAGGSKPPAVADKKAQLASRQNGFAQKVQALRVATGKIESRRVYFRCACTSGGFYADFERMNPAERFRIARIERETPAAQAATPAGVAGGFGLARRRADTAFDYQEFDTSGWHCPWCNIGGIFVHCCSCGENVCQGKTTVRPDGKEWFICHPGCGTAGTLTQTDKIHGAAAPPPGLLPAARRASPTALPGTVKRAPLLPGNRANRLLGGHRQ